MRNPARLAASILLLTMPLLGWRQIHASNPHAWAALLLPFVLVWLGVASLRLDLNRARLSAALIPGTWPSRLLSGRIGALLAGFGFAALAIPVLAWQAISTPPADLLAMLALGTVAGGLCLGTGRWFTAWLRPAWVRAANVRLATLATALIFLPLVVWMNWALRQYPMAYKDLGLLDALQYGLNGLPDLPYPEAWVMQTFQLAESAKLWLVHRFDRPVLTGLLHSLDSALVVFVTARAFVAVTDLVRERSGGSLP